MGWSDLSLGLGLRASAIPENETVKIKAERRAALNISKINGVGRLVLASHWDLEIPEWYSIKLRSAVCSLVKRYDESYHQ